MSKQIIWFSLAIAMTAALYQPIKQVKYTKVEDKSVSFSIFKSISYNSEAYSNTSAQVQITVEKVNTNGEHKKVWVKTYSAKYLSQYPDAAKALSGTVVVSNLNSKKEYLQVTYILTYNSKGQELQIQGGDVIKEKNKTNDISI